MIIRMDSTYLMGGYVGHIECQNYVKMLMKYKDVNVSYW